MQINGVPRLNVREPSLEELIKALFVAGDQALAVHWRQLGVLVILADNGIHDIGPGLKGLSLAMGEAHKIKSLQIEPDKPGRFIFEWLRQHGQRWSWGSFSFLDPSTITRHSILICAYGRDKNTSKLVGWLRRKGVTVKMV